MSRRNHTTVEHTSKGLKLAYLALAGMSIYGAINPDTQVWGFVAVGLIIVPFLHWWNHG